jgi:hypothetical protein
VVVSRNVAEQIVLQSWVETNRDAAKNLVLLAQMGNGNETQICELSTNGSGVKSKLKSRTICKRGIVHALSKLALGQSAVFAAG